MTLEATRPNTLLGKRAIRMGTWNVRTMFEMGKTFQVASEMRACNLALLESMRHDGLNLAERSCIQASCCCIQDTRI